MPVKANNPQADFLCMPHKFRAFVAGYGSGKTWVGCMAKCIHYLEHPGINQGYFAPSFPHIRDIFYPTMEEVAYGMGLNTKVKLGDKEVQFYTGQQYRGTTICRSMDRPETIVGFKIGNGLIDELDVLKMIKAEMAWRKIIARMRYKPTKGQTLKNGLDLTTTPEGFRFTHKAFVEALEDKPELKKNYGLIQASTHDNAKNLPDDYIDSLLETYPDELKDAYVNGKFTNLTSGTVYRGYKRKLHRSYENIIAKEPLYIGMDFNVGHMAATIYVQRPSGWHAVAEIKDVFDTPDMIRILKERWYDKKHPIFVYPDASGKNRKSVGASTSDIGLIEQAKFAVRVKPSNPAVKDRIMSVNKQFQDGQLWINDKACPTTAKNLEQQAYDDNGEPDKKSGFDHQCFDGEQEVFINGSKMKFKNIPETGEVLCPDGKYHKYINGGVKKDSSRMLLITLSNGDTVTCTEDHKFLTCTGWKKSIDLLGEKLCNQKLLAKLNKSIVEKNIICAENISKTQASGCIEKFLKIITGAFRKVSLSIIETKTKLTMCLPILSLCQKDDIPHYMENKKQLCRLKLSMQRFFGIKVKRAEDGTENIIKLVKNHSLQKDTVDFVSNAVKRFSLIEKGYVFARTTVTLHTEEQAGLITRRELAQFVEKSLNTINTRRKKRVLESAPRVLRIEQRPAGKAYCLTVPDIGMFEVSGVIASNCDATGYPIAYEFPIVKPIFSIPTTFAM